MVFQMPHTLAVAKTRAVANRRRTVRPGSKFQVDPLLAHDVRHVQAFNQPSNGCLVFGLSRRQAYSRLSCAPVFELNTEARRSTAGRFARVLFAAPIRIDVDIQVIRHWTPREVQYAPWNPLDVPSDFLEILVICPRRG